MQVQILAEQFSSPPGCVNNNSMNQSMLVSMMFFFHMMVFQHNSTVIVSIHAFAVNLPDYKHRYIASCASGYIEATANSLNFEK